MGPTPAERNWQTRSGSPPKPKLTLFGAEISIKDSPKLAPSLCLPANPTNPRVLLTAAALAGKGSRLLRKSAISFSSA